VEYLRLPRFDQRNPAVASDGRFVTYVTTTLNNMIARVEAAINAIASIPEIEAALAGLDAATQAAQTAADNAQAAADTVTAASDLANSYPTGLTVTATDAGASASISISAHTRVYGGGTSVPVNAGSVTALAYDTYYYIYYDDPTRNGGAVTYAATIDEAVAAQTGDRHVVGATMTPTAGQPDNSGTPVRPPGAGTIQREVEL